MLALKNPCFRGRLLNKLPLQMALLKNKQRGNICHTLKRLLAKFGLIFPRFRTSSCRKTDFFHPGLLNKLPQYVAQSKIRPRQTLRHRPECLSSKFGAFSSIPRATLPKKTRTVRINFPLYTVHERVIFVVFLRFAAHFVRSSAAKKKF